MSKFPRIKWKFYEVVNADEIKNHFINNIKVEDWISYPTALALVCDTKMMLMLKRVVDIQYTKYIFDYRITSLLGNKIDMKGINQKQIEEFIVLGADINIKQKTIIQPIYDRTQKTLHQSLLQSCIDTNNIQSIRLLLRHMVDTSRVTLTPEYQAIVNAVKTNRRAARILLGIKKHKKIYPRLDRFIFREIALAIWSARDTI
jgi:hypothetical protein